MKGIFSYRDVIRTYWIRVLIVVILNLALFYIYVRSIRDIGMFAFMNFINLLLSIFIFIQGVKRMHDVNKSGWYLFIPIYNLILALTKGIKGENKYGSDPKYKQKNQ